MSSAPLLFTDEKGDIREIVESKVVDLAEVDQAIIDAREHLNRLQELRDKVWQLQNPDGIATPSAASGAPVADLPVPAASEPQVAASPAADANVGAPVAANSEQGQAPVHTPTQSPQANTSAFNNGQADPAAASNPTPAFEQPSAPISDVTPPVPAAPVING